MTPFTLNDFRRHLARLTRPSWLRRIALRLADEKQLLGDEAQARHELLRAVAIIDSMTPTERVTPAVIDRRRTERIARGSGTTPRDVRQLVTMYQALRPRMEDRGAVADVNPYRSPSNRHRLRWGRRWERLDAWASRFAASVIRPSVLLSFFAVLHFLASLMVWSVGVVWGMRFGFDFASWIWLLGQASPAILLFVLSVVSLIRSLRRRRLASAMVILVYVISACVFSYDVATKRAQMRVDIAASEYWDSGGSEYTYFTWWWYNDRWFRRRS
jgi:hypothetical protein